MLGEESWNYDRFCLDVDDVLPLVNLQLNEDESVRYLNGQKLQWRWDLNSPENLFWVRDSHNEILGIGTKEEEKLKVVFNFERETASTLIP